MPKKRLTRNIFAGHAFNGLQSFFGQLFPQNKGYRVNGSITATSVNASCQVHVLLCYLDSGWARLPYTQATVSVQQVTANQKGSVELSALLLLSPRKNSDLHYCLTLI